MSALDDLSTSERHLGLFPGCVYLVSCWYVRYEVQKRYVK
jgi:hypothetical protein